GDIYYDLQANTGNPDFNGRDLGTFTLTETLFLTDGQNKIFKCENDDVTDGKLYYRIFLQGDTPGSFSSFQLNNVIFEEDNHFCFNDSDKNQTWENDPIPNPSIDLSSGLNGGDYFLEVYTTA